MTTADLLQLALALALDRVRHARTETERAEALREIAATLAALDAYRRVR